ncbi:unnamed protein product [Adineta ricciae]|uniref:site-specific DNA-methyltransferase (cytosine-N(4)-specific) n=1 Tax=Adineta ricciae TaxID=249248 RepID=A0A814VCD2_ADIRI|nr:unnamed protein product [Adineta ricciae]CAF1185031.1 unnamed protein product [Adineta ricciae]
MCNEIQEKQSETIDLTKNDEDENVDSAKNTHEDLSTYCCSFRIVVRNEASLDTTVTSERTSQLHALQPDEHRTKSSLDKKEIIKRKSKSLRNKYVVVDSLEGLKKLPNNSVQCIVTSPPYNKLGLREGRPYLGQIIYDTYDDNMKEEEYQQWQLKILNEINRVLKPNGSAFYNHKDRRYCRQDYRPEDFVSKSDLKMYQTLIWDRGSTVNQNTAYFRPNVEKIFWLTKASSGTPKFYRDRLPECFKGSVWRIPPEKKNKHPAPFPLILSEICILATTDEGDLVLDPFAGSGTTLLAAANLKRSYLGFDLSHNYKMMFRQRIAASKKIHLWEQMYIVEKIVDHRIRNGCMEYLLKWKGYSEKENTWELEENLHCPGLLQQFKASLSNQKKAKSKSSNKRPVKLIHSNSSCDRKRSISSISSSSSDQSDESEMKRRCRGKASAISKTSVYSELSDDDYENGILGGYELRRRR